MMKLEMVSIFFSEYIFNEGCRTVCADTSCTIGTTSVTVLAAELLREAERLVTLARVHPQT